MKEPWRRFNDMIPTGLSPSTCSIKYLVEMARPHRVTSAVRIHIYLGG